MTQLTQAQIEEMMEAMSSEEMADYKHHNEVRQEMIFAETN